MDKDNAFTGFSQETFDFLGEVEDRNSKDWFEKNRPIYNLYVLQPLKALVADLAPSMLAIDAQFETTPAINKTISRIFRDTRFSRDKRLFRGNMWITFKRRVKNWKDSPAYFFEIFPDWYRFGMGYYNASRATMDALRSRIDENPDEFLKAISCLKKQNFFEVIPDHYKRKIPNEHGEKIQLWYQCRSFYLSCKRNRDELLFSQELVNELSFAFHTINPLYQFLREIHDEIYAPSAGLGI
ncbi:MAG: DUF2461 domain-containing protein [Calditrichaeota bacterium]|nr:DUF2461 domain-containing protein [Calditrichota bacterium]